MIFKGLCFNSLAIKNLGNTKPVCKYVKRAFWPSFGHKYLFHLRLSCLTFELVMRLSLLCGEGGGEFELYLQWVMIQF